MLPWKADGKVVVEAVHAVECKSEGESQGESQGDGESESVGWQWCAPVFASTGFFKSNVTLMMVQIISSLSLFDAYCKHFSTTLLANLCWEKSSRLVCTSLMSTALSASHPCCITNCMT